ncbi:hypothetical protein ACFYWY_36455 [Streptomyces sp. NPDC002870]|uniref:hypothetical protein n=1 Tax=Streptomyces sp. NPDC002870 TaxID=3364666 RepID=UPI00369C6AD4
MLTLNPKKLPRLDELEEDLLARRERAIAEDWQGEVDGIDLTLSRSARRSSSPGFFAVAQEARALQSRSA